MDILKRVSKDGKVIGVELDMDGYVCPFPTKALYMEQILVPLHDAGYKFYDYHGDIELPDGRSVDSLETVDINTYPESEISGFDGMLMTADMNALTDTEASQYYAYRSTMQKIELRTEASYEINTREEFERYIKQQEVMIAAVGYSNDNRPINSFVNPKALFTMEEILDDANGVIYKKLNILGYRRKFKNYAAYQSVVNYLRDKGVLNTAEPTTAEFISAYYTWGPDGIRGDLINMKFKQGVDGEFKTPDDDLPASADKVNHAYANRRKVPFILDTDATLRHLNAETSMNGILNTEEFARSPLAIMEDRTFINTKRRDNKGFKYSLGYALKTNVSDRVYFTFIVNGFKYIYKASVDAVAMFIASRSTPVWSSSIKFSIATIIGAVDIPLDEVKSLNDYLLWNICTNEAARCVKEMTVDAPVNSTYELLMSVGMTPISAVRYMACHILNKSPYESNIDMRDMYDGLTVECVDKFYQPIPDAVYEAFMLEPESVPGIREFIDMADVDNLRDRRELMELGELTPGMRGYDSTYVTNKDARLLGGDSNDAIHYYNNIKFVMDCISGAVSIDAFGDGLLKDIGKGTKIAADVLMSIIYAELGETPDLDKATNIIRNLVPMRILDIANLFMARDNAYKGYLIDYSRARKCKADMNNTWCWAYVSKVFRELGNKPIEETRPYLLELIVLQNDKKGMIFRKALVDCIKEAIDKAEMFPKTPIIENTKHPDHGMTYYDAALNMLDDVASRLFFTILGKKGYTVDGDEYIYNIKFDAEHDVDIRIPSKVATLCQGVTADRANHVRYITIYDTCEREFNHYAKDGAFALHIVNADITPWSVAPRKGFKIGTYNLLPSYYKVQSLVDKFGTQWYENAKNNKAISNMPLIDMLPRLEVPTYATEEQVIINQELKGMVEYADFDSCLFRNCTEQVAHYVKRWSAACKLARARGKIVEHMPLKQDILYLYLVELIANDSIQDELTFKDGENTALSGTETSVLRHGVIDLLAIDTHAGQLSFTQVRQGEITTEQFADIYLNLISRGKSVVVSGNWITGLGEDICVPMAPINHPTIQRLLSEYAVKYGNEYYIVGIKGIYKIGVKA